MTKVARRGRYNSAMRRQKRLQRLHEAQNGGAPGAETPPGKG